MHSTFAEIRRLLANFILSGEARFFYNHMHGCVACILGDMVFEFKEEEDESLTVRYQNIDLLWMRETEGWDVVRNAILKVSEEDDDDRTFYAINRHVINSLHQRLIAHSQECKE